MSSNEPIVDRHWPYWLGGTVFAFILLWLLSDMLLPFVVGMAIAYFLDPVADRLERVGLSRGLATATLTLLFFFVVALAVVLLVPVIQSQLTSFLANMPRYAASLREKLMPLAEQVMAALEIDAGPEKVRAAIESHAEQAAQVAGRFLSGLLSGGRAVAGLLSLVLITPVVSFYLLRDWDKITSRVDHWLPRKHSDTIRRVAQDIDNVIAGFARGQAIVCLTLASYYGIGLSIAGLEFGLFIGVAAGSLSFIPYVGAGIGFVTAISVALIQYWPEAQPILIVCAIFAVGQILEGYILTPNLVGDRIGLHPVWIIFALLAGGSLFGFVGVLLAVPIFAVIGVLARFTLARYLASPIYHGGKRHHPGDHGH